MVKEVKKEFTREEAKSIYQDMKLESIDDNEFWMGLNTELEHGRVNSVTNISNDDPIITAKIAIAHLSELSNYYTLLKNMEDEAKKEKTNKESKLKDLDKIVSQAIREVTSEEMSEEVKLHLINYLETGRTPLYDAFVMTRGKGAINQDVGDVIDTLTDLISELKR